MELQKLGRYTMTLETYWVKLYENILLVLLINKRKKSLERTNNMNDKICGISSKERVLWNKKITKLLGSISEYFWRNWQT